MREGWVRIRGWRPFGAELRLHWTLVVVVLAAVLCVARDPAFMALVVAAYFLTLVVHEFGHAVMARRLGLRVEGLEFSPVHGRCCYVAFREMSEREHLLIALAGPTAQLGLAVVVLALGAVPAIRDFDPFGPVYVFAGFFNVVWAGMNLLPVKGLDGELPWKMLAERARRTWRRARSRKRKPTARPPLRRIK